MYIISAVIEIKNLVKERDSDEASKDPGKIVKLHMDLANFKLGSKGTALVTVTITFIFELKIDQLWTLDKV